MTIPSAPSAQRAARPAVQGLPCRHLGRDSAMGEATPPSPSCTICRAVSPCAAGIVADMNGVASRSGGPDGITACGGVICSTPPRAAIVLTLPGVGLLVRCPAYRNFCALFGLRFCGMLITIQEISSGSNFGLRISDCSRLSPQSKITYGVRCGAPACPARFAKAWRAGYRRRCPRACARPGPGHPC